MVRLDCLVLFGLVVLVMFWLGLRCFVCFVLLCLLCCSVMLLLWWHECSKQGAVVLLCCLAVWFLLFGFIGW